MYQSWHAKFTAKLVIQVKMFSALTPTRKIYGGPTFLIKYTDKLISFKLKILSFLTPLVSFSIVKVMFKVIDTCILNENYV